MVLCVAAGELVFGAAIPIAANIAPMALNFLSDLNMVWWCLFFDKGMLGGEGWKGQFFLGSGVLRGELVH